MIIVWGHLVNSVLYALVAIPSRLFFTRVDFRHGEELFSLEGVMRSHMNSPGLTLDIVALVGLFAEIAHRLEPSHKGPLPTAAQWLMLMQLLKGWRVVLPEDSAARDRGFWQGIFKLLCVLVAFAHAVACSFLLAGNIEVAGGDKSWFDHTPYNVDMEHCVVRYTEAFHFAVIGLTSVGYEDLLLTSLEHGLNSFVLLISQLFASKVCAELTWLTSMYNQHEAELHEGKRSLVLALDKMGAPKVLVKRVMAFQSYEDTMHADNMENETFTGLGKNLMEELRLCTYRKLVLQAPFLREQPTAVISFIVKALWDEVYLPSDFIVRAGERGRELFFLRRGEARAYLGPNAPVWGQSDAVAIIKTGSYFGELAMLTGAPRGSFVLATSYCICSILPYSAVEDLVERHPEAFTSLVQTMVRMFKLRSELSWKDLSVRLTAKFGFKTDSEAFAWFKSHWDNSFEDDLEPPELNAKSFDLALQTCKVQHLDRIIFWSEMDKDASGGISYEEFQGKLHFDVPSHELSPSSASAASTARFNGLKKRRNSLDSISFSKKEQETLIGSSSSKTGALGMMNIDSMPHNATLFKDGSTDKEERFDALLDENRQLIEDIQRWHASISLQ